MRGLIGFLVLLITGCSHAPVAKTVAQTSKKAEGRRPADSDDGSPQKAPVVRSLPLQLYSWGNDVSNLAAGAAASKLGVRLTRAQGCVDQISRAKSEAAIAGCEGNGMAAGPGVYVTDNPFTSHDYGQILLVVTMAPNLNSVGLVTGSLAAPPGAGGLDRFYTGDKSLDALVYNFRDDDFGGRAAALRSPRIVSGAQAIDARPSTWAPMKTHAAHACTSASSVNEVLAAWADQLEFLATTYVSSREPTGSGYVANGQLTGAGVAAAVASDVVAQTDANLAATLQKLNAKHANLQLASNDCEDLGAMNPRTCLATRIFDSIVGNMGSDNYPTYAWDLPTTVSVLADLGFLKPAAFGSNDKLMQALRQSYLANPEQSARALEAYQCMSVIKQRVGQLGLHSLGPDPQ